MIKKNKGFTLIEISIVLVIVGLIVGTVLGGQEILRRSILNKFIKEIQAIDYAMLTFITKYNQIAGDMSNATFFWATAQSGDGNGYIESYARTGKLEAINVWSHLNLSEIYLNQQAPMTVYSAANVFIPKSVYPNTFWGIGYLDYAGSNSTASITSNLIRFGSQVAGSDLPGSYTMTAVDMAYIDKKIDDGKPFMGKLRVNNWNSLSTCASPYYSSNTADYPDSEYLTTTTTPACAGLFVTNY